SRGAAVRRIGRWWYGIGRRDLTVRPVDPLGGCSGVGNVWVGARSDKGVRLGHSYRSRPASRRRGGAPARRNGRGPAAGSRSGGAVGAASAARSERWRVAQGAALAGAVDPAGAWVGNGVGELSGGWTGSGALPRG